MRPTLRAKNTIAYLVVAAGRGSRAGEGLPKQYRSLGNRAVLSHIASALHASAPEAVIQVVIHPDDQSLYDDCLVNLEPLAHTRLQPSVFGGATRQESVKLGLEALAKLTTPEIVLIHDAARPFVDRDIVERAVEAAQKYGAAAPGVALTDTVKQVDDQLIGCRYPRAAIFARSANTSGVSISRDSRGAPKGCLIVIGNTRMTR